MLTLPTSSMTPLRARLQTFLNDPTLLRISISFWLFGLINNIFYVIILSAALDLVGPSIPKATVLLASIIPGLATKAVVPYFIHLIPYSLRIWIFVALSTCGMLAVALSPATADAESIAAKVAGIILANISSGAGEVNFLGLTHYYGTYSLAAWGSGTGGAGLIGAGAYALATTTMGFSVRATLVASAILPLVMLGSFFQVLPRGPLVAAKQDRELRKAASTGDGELEGRDEEADEAPETAGLLDPPGSSSSAAVTTAYVGAKHSSSFTSATSPPPLPQRLWIDLKAKLDRSKNLLLPYMVPLFLVYLAEYTINQGVAPTLLFPLPTTPFKHYRAFYPTYSALYQAGVFISRSSLPFLRIRTLYLPSILQVINLLLLTAQANWGFIPSVWIIFAIIFWEGLLGGLVYVSTYAAIREEVEVGEREFSLGAVTVADSGGIFVAGIVGAVLEGRLCQWQVSHGRDWCRRL